MKSIPKLDKASLGPSAMSNLVRVACQDPPATQHRNVLIAEKFWAGDSSSRLGEARATQVAREREVNSLMG